MSEIFPLQSLTRTGSPVCTVFSFAGSNLADHKTTQPLKLGRHAAGLVKDDIYLGREVIYAKDE